MRLWNDKLMLPGPPGVEKAHLPVSLGMIAAGAADCHNLISQLNKARCENQLSERLKMLSKYRVLIIDEIGHLQMDIHGANPLFPLIIKRFSYQVAELVSFQQHECRGLIALQFPLVAIFRLYTAQQFYL